jgi:flagellar biosynthesis protein FlhG
MRQVSGGQQAVAGSPVTGPGQDSAAAPASLERLDAPARIWAIASGKGGVGRSFLTANLGCVLADHVGPVVLADLDFGGGNLHTFLGQPAGTAGMGAFLQGQVDRLQAVARSGEIPGLGLVQGLGGAPVLPNSRSRARLLRGLRRVDAPLAVIDLESGAAAPVLDFFVAADRPVLVVLPEPAAVENAHRFIRQVYLRQLELSARARGVERVVFRRLVGEASPQWKPAELLTRLERLSAGLGQALSRELEGFRLYLLVNQVRHASDVGVGQSLKSAVQSFFGITVRYVGAVRYDADAWWSVRRRRLRVRESSSGDLAVELEQVARNLLQDRELDPPEGAPALLP